MNAIAPDALAALTGTEVGVSRWQYVTQERIDAFADLTDDPQFIHVDPVRAEREGPYGTTVAHGFLTLSLLSPMARDALPEIAGARHGVNYGFDRMRFVAPVRAGKRVRGRFTLKRCERRADGALALTWTVTIEIEGEARPAVVADWIVLRYLVEA